MTTLTSHRALAVTRLQFVNTWGIFGLPSIIMGTIFAANLLIWALIFANTDAQSQADVQNGLQYSGAASYIFVYMAIVAVQSIAVTFPFAQGYGVTRRHYYLGASLGFVILAAIYSTAVAILGLLEELTHGWGFGGRMFTAVYFGGDSALSQWLIYFVFMLFFFFVGAMFGTIFVRWKGTGITLTFVLLGFLAIGALALLGLVFGWDETFSFFDGLGDVGRGGVILLITLAAALVGFLVLRRATPRN